MTTPCISLVTTTFQGRKNLETYLPRNLEVVRATPLIGEVVVADGQLRLVPGARIQSKK